jgi:hypothetical protein
VLALPQPLYDLLDKCWFRLEVTGWERVPERTYLVVGVHSGGALPMDAWTLVHAWGTHFRGERILHGTAHDVLVATPVLGDCFRAVGVIAAHRDSVTRPGRGGDPGGDGPAGGAAAVARPGLSPARACQGDPVDLDEVADELYRLPPEEFIPARRQREAEAKADGDRALAAEIARLGKPSTAAWVANLLAREQPDDVAQLVELGGLLREAQENLAGAELKALDVQRRRLVAALTRQARSLAYEQGHPVSTGVADQVEETLRAAMADPDAGAALVAGHLTTALSYSGLGTAQRADLRVVPPPREKPAAKPVPRPVPRPAPAQRRGDGESAAQRRAREKAEAERQAAEERRRRQLEQARAALDEAAAVAEETAAAAEAERARVEELREQAARLEVRIAQLSEELDRARTEHAEAGHERSRAERRQSAATRRATDAARARDRARHHLDQLESG